MANGRLLIGALLVLLEPGFDGAARGEPVRLEAGNAVFVSARLESTRKSFGPTVVAKVSYENVGVAAQHAPPYIVEPCSALQITKYNSKQELLKTKDARGVRHTFEGDWVGRLHSTEQECREYLAAHPFARVTENRNLRYELQNP